jgi:DHA1 family bicyclomycin/chloramphenicol resistance-like MFS transporter
MIDCRHDRQACGSCNPSHVFSEKMKRKIGWLTTLTLGLLTAFGPFVTDFYLPVMPEMAHYFATSPALIAMSLTAGMLGLALGQVLIGPLSDRYGRKTPLLLSLLLFIMASVGCVFSPTVMLFNVCRLFQGLGGAGAIVLSKSFATDWFAGRELQRFMAVLGAINGVTPVFAPVIGGTLSEFTSWKGIFVLLLGIGVVLLACSMTLRESLVPERRITTGFGTIYANLFRVFRNPRFSYSTVAMMFCGFAFFGYISSSTFILQKIYGLSPFQFSLCFGLNAIMIAVGAAVCTLFRHQNTALKWGAIHLVIGSVLVALCLLFRLPLFTLMISYIWMLTAFGIMQPALTAIALDAERDNAGAASAIFGASMFLAGAVSSPLVSMGQMTVSASVVMVSGMAVCLLMVVPLCREIKEEGRRQQE